MASTLILVVVHRIWSIDRMLIESVVICKALQGDLRLKALTARN
jgi:hypothetical protein